MDLVDKLARELFPNNPNKKEQLREYFEYWDKMVKPPEDELRRSMTLNAEDYSPIVYAS